MWRLPQNLKDVYGLKGEGEEEMGEQRSGADRQERKSLPRPREEALALLQGTSP